MNRWKVTIEETRCMGRELKLVVTEQVEWCDTREEARKLIRRRFNNHNSYTTSAKMEYEGSNDHRRTKSVVSVALTIAVCQGD